MSWFDKLISDNLFDQAVCVALRLSSGEVITQSLVIKSIVEENNQQWLMLANGTQLSLDQIQDLYNHENAKMPEDYLAF